MEWNLFRKKEVVQIPLEEKLVQFRAFYNQHEIVLPPNFEDIMRDIWKRNAHDIKGAIDKNGFDEMLLMPGNMPLDDLHSKMTKGYNPTREGANFQEAGSFHTAQSKSVEKSRIVLVNKVQNLKDDPKFKKVLFVRGENIRHSQLLILEDYLVFQRKYFEENYKHLDTVGWSWVATMSGDNLVYTGWDNLGQAPETAKLRIAARPLDAHAGKYEAQGTRAYPGARPVLSFY